MFISFSSFPILLDFISFFLILLVQIYLSVLNFNGNVSQVSLLSVMLLVWKTAFTGRNKFNFLNGLRVTFQKRHQWVLSFTTYFHWIFQDFLFLKSYYIIKLHWHDFQILNYPYILIVIIIFMTLFINEIECNIFSLVYSCQLRFWG